MHTGGDLIGRSPTGVLMGTGRSTPPAFADCSVVTDCRGKTWTETTYRYWLLEPGGVQRRVALDPFKVVGRFTIAEQKNGKAASEALSALGRPRSAAIGAQR